MDLSDEITRILTPLLRRFQRSTIWKFTLGLCWCLLHLLVSIVHIGSYLIQVLACYIISFGLLEKYRVSHLNRLRYLAIVVDSVEAKSTTKIKQLLQWLSAVGVKHTILYDMDGVLKKSMETDLKNLADSSITSCSVSYDLDFLLLLCNVHGTLFFIKNADIKATTSLHQERMTIEVLSFSDGKEGTAKAASLLCSKYLKGDTLGCNKIAPVFTETDMADSLKAVGCGGPEPDLLLVFGPARCHLGFPAWRMRYTEIVHMGPLKSIKYGAIVKIIHDFSRKHQNYGS